MSNTSPAAEKKAHLSSKHEILRIGGKTLISLEHFRVKNDLIEKYFLNVQVVLLTKKSENFVF